MWLRSVGQVTLAALFLCVPALADSYEFVNFNPPVYSYPFALFGGGTIEEGPAGSFLEATGIGSHFAPQIEILITPGFSVHEITLDVYSYPGFGGGGGGDLGVAANDVNGNPVLYQPIENVGLNFVDIKSATPFVEVFFAESYYPEAGFSIADVTFNPSAAPSSVTPEPSAIALLGTGLLGLAGALRRRRRVEA